MKVTEIVVEKRRAIEQGAIPERFRADSSECHTPYLAITMKLDDELFST